MCSWLLVYTCASSTAPPLLIPSSLVPLVTCSACCLSRPLHIIIITWPGKKGNTKMAQKALRAQAAANQDVVLGQYQAGSCVSVGTDGNTQQAAGPY